MSKPRRRVWRILLGVVALLALLGGAGLLLVYERPLSLALERTRYHLWRDGAHSRYVQVDGHRIHYFDLPARNGASGTPLLLVHGLGARSEDWSPMLPALAANGFHVYALDLLGYGRSDHPADADYGIAQEEQTVLGFMRAVGLSHADVAGWSMGGWITMKLALDHPELVDRLVLYDSAGLYYQATYSFSVFTPADAAGVHQLLALLMPQPPKIPGFIVRDLVRSMGKNAWVLRRSVASMTSGRDLLDFRIHALRPPTLIVWGEEDTLIPPSTGETLHRLVPGSVLALQPGCGHLAPAECAQTVVAETIAFLRAEPPMHGGQITLPTAPKTQLR